MKILRRVILILLIVITAAVLAGYLLPRRVHVEQTAAVKALQSAVYGQVNELRNWKHWSPWLRLDTAMQVTYSGAESGSGAAFAWNSRNKDIGSGKLLIMKDFPNDSVILLMDFGESGSSSGKFVFTKKDSVTLVTWSMDSDLGNNPVDRWFGMLTKKYVARDFEKGLSNLAGYFADQENQGIRVAVELLPARTLISMRDTASPATISTKMSLMYGAVSRFIQRRKLTCTGPPVAIFHQYSDTLFDLEAALPVSATAAVPKGINCVAYGPQKVVKAEYFGPFEKTVKAYAAIQKFMKDKDLVTAGPPFEEYITDPASQPDTALWQTNICVPVK